MLWDESFYMDQHPQEEFKQIHKTVLGFPARAKDYIVEMSNKTVI